MAVKKIIGKVLTKYDTESPNFKPIEKKVEEVSGNVTPKNEENVYGERKHYYTPDQNGNLQMEQLMGKLIHKIDNIPGQSQTGTKAVEIDIKREIAIGKVDASAVKSEEFKGKVMNKKDKLKALRRRRNNGNK